MSDETVLNGEVLNGELDRRPRLNRWLLVLAAVGLMSLPISLYIVLDNGMSRDNKLNKVTKTNRQTIRKVQIALTDIQKERKERTDQSCRTDEDRHLRDVRQLRNTYKFILHPNSSLRDLVPLILVQLPQLENQTRDVAAPFCDEPGVGLPEPDPQIPCRPKQIHLPQPSSLRKICSYQVH